MMDWIGLVLFVVVVAGFAYWKGIGPFKKCMCKDCKCDPCDCK